MSSRNLTNLKLRRLTFKNKDYALDESNNNIYDLRLAKSGRLFLVGELRTYPHNKRRFFIRLADSPKIIESTKLIIGKKLDKINLNKHSKFIESEFTPGGPGYYRAKSRFETQKRKRSRARAKSLSARRKKSHSKTSSRKRKTKSIG